jgi:hypothetical protein
MKVVRLSAVCTSRLYPQEIFLVLISVKRPIQPQGHIATGKIMSMKKSSDTIGNQTCNILICSAVPQPLRHHALLLKEREVNNKRGIRHSVVEILKEIAT